MIDNSPANIDEAIERIEYLAAMAVSGPVLTRKLNLLKQLVARIKDGEVLVLPDVCIEMSPTNDEIQKWLMNRLLDFRDKGFLQHRE